MPHHCGRDGDVDDQVGVSEREGPLRITDPETLVTDAIALTARMVTPTRAVRVS